MSHSRFDMTKALRVAAHELEQLDLPPRQAKFLVRGIDVLKNLATQLDPQELSEANRSPSAAMALLTAMGQPSARRVFKSDPLGPARARGLRAWNAILAEEGGTLDAEEAAMQLGVSIEDIEQRRKAGRVLAVDTGTHGYRYPVWQFIGASMLPGLEEILLLLAGHPPLAQMRFFLSGNLRLEGKRPLDMLRRGAVEQVRRAARTFGEHGAA